MPISIALIHATHAAVQPVEEAFAQDWPEAAAVSLLAEDLTRDLAEAGKQTPEIRARIDRLARFAVRAGVDGILFTCSAFAESIEAARRDLAVPVLKPNEAMFEEALALGPRIGMLVTFEPAIDSMEAELKKMAEENGREAVLSTYFVPGALEALKAGRPSEHHHLIAEAAAALPRVDALMLAQFSMAGAKPIVEKAYGATVLSSPNSAIGKLKTLIRTRRGNSC